MIPHIALLPSAGMGHLIPFLRLAAKFSSRNCLVTLITAKPTVSAAEEAHISSFLSTYPEIKILEFQILPLDQTGLEIKDPFFLQFEAIRRSVHLLSSLLSSSSPPFSAIFTDVTLAACIAEIASEVSIPNYVVFTSSAKFLSLITYLPVVISNSANFGNGGNRFVIPGISNPLPKSSIPPPFSNPNHFFTKEIVSNSQASSKSKGIIVNTFEYFESEALTALNNGGIVSNLPPVFSIGPLKPYQIEDKQCEYQIWLNNQPEESVVFVSFGSRTALSEDQIREIGNGLNTSGFRFLWILKTSKVDKDEKDELTDLLGETFLENTKTKGLIVKDWVNQDEILGHPAIKIFVSHCGWNSLTEAALRGVPVLAWPQHGDQRVNAEVVQEAGLGICDRSWGWGGERLVTGEEIRGRIKELMEDEELKVRARNIGEEARKACSYGGSPEKTVISIIETFKQKK